MIFSRDFYGLPKKRISLLDSNLAYDRTKQMKTPKYIFLKKIFLFTQSQNHLNTGSVNRYTVYTLYVRNFRIILSR